MGGRQGCQLYMRSIMGVDDRLREGGRLAGGTYDRLCGFGEGPSQLALFLALDV